MGNVEIKNKDLCKVGEKVFWLNAYGNMDNGVITRIIPGNDTKESYAEIKSRGCVTGAKLSHCFRTKKEAADAEKLRAEKQQAEYAGRINSAKDLICFMYRHEFHAGEYCDEDARAVVKLKIKELLDIEADKIEI